MKLHLFRTALLLAILICLSGCETLNVRNMVADNVQTTQHPVTVALAVTGGSAGVQWYSGTISPKQFEDAAHMSLEKAPLFAAMANKDSAEYLLNVKLTYAGSHPGFNMTAWVNANWVLIERVSGREAWQAMIKGEGHATVGEAFSGAKRQFMALERAGKSNIAQAMSQLGDLQLPKL